MRHTTREMSDRHERYVNNLFGFRPSPGSGNQFTRPLDGRHDGTEPYAFGHDCKSTLHKSISVSLSAWAKVIDQARGLRPMMPLRFYKTEGLVDQVDLVVLHLDDFAEVWEDAVRWRQQERAKHE